MVEAGLGGAGMGSETTVEAEWPFDDVTGTVTVSGFVSPRVNASWDDPAEGGVEGVRVIDSSGEELPLSPEQRDWAVEQLEQPEDNFHDYVD